VSHRHAPRAQPRLRRIAAVGGLALGATALATGGHLMLQPAQVVAVDAGSLPDAATGGAPVSTTRPTTGVDEGSPVRVTGAAPSKPTIVPVLSRHGQEPVRLGVPAVGVMTDVEPVGVDARGVLNIPADPQVVGWWAAGAAAGASAGNVVLAGHVDTAAGVGAMRELVDLPMGSLVEVTDDTGATTRYRIVARESFGKADGIPASLFRADGPPGLVLITCGGTFDARSGHYTENVVLVGVPA
jgi:Sortase domain